jgi:hypothetical protein
VTRIRTIAHGTNEVRLRSDPLSEPIYWQGRQWAVTSYGIECRDGTYTIAANRLTEELLQEHPWTWVGQLGDKPEWVDLEDFTTAYFVACTIHRHALRQQDLNLVLKHFAQAKSDADTED